METTQRSDELRRFCFRCQVQPCHQERISIAATWTVSAPLKRGQNYFWEVSAVKNGKEIVVPVAPAPRAQFRIIEAQKLGALQNLKRTVPTSHLALGLTYARLGLIKDAEEEFQYLIKENPDSATAKKLLRTVQGWSR